MRRLQNFINFERVGEWRYGFPYRLRLLSIGRYAIKIISAVLLAALTSGVAQGQQSNPGDLANKSLDELINIKVTSPSKREERLFQSATAVYVITQEDIRRSGMTSIPDLLRMVPGLDVAQIDGTKWAVGARGFNGRFANKLLVLIDGRSVYSPETSGVYWEALGVPLEDIERIEVIRGPGGTLWGANAVNGVINIITKKAVETQGVELTAVAGTEYGESLLQYGGKAGNSAYFRTYAQYENLRGLVDNFGHQLHDGKNSVSGGFRFDWDPSSTNSVTIQGSIFDRSLMERSTTVSLLAPLAAPGYKPGEFTGGDILVKWDHEFSDRSQISIQSYYDRSVRQVYDLGERIDTFDFDFQHELELNSRNRVVWGLGYRLVKFQTNSDFGNPVSFDPKSNTRQVFSGFVQDEFVMVKDKANLDVGIKIEHNDFTGVEFQPNLKLALTPSDSQTFWASISRAVRTPSLSDQFISINLAAFPGENGLLNVLKLLGSSSFKSENLVAYEAGYRKAIGDNFSIDLAAFYNIYHHLESEDIGLPFIEQEPSQYLVIPEYFANRSRGTSYGAEASLNVQVLDKWKLSGSYSFLRMIVRSEDPASSIIIENPGNSPQHQFQIRSYVDLTEKLQLDASLFYVSRLSAQQVPAYSRFDVRFGWRPTEKVEFSVGGRNLLKDHHLEFQSQDDSVLPTQVGREFYGKITWRFK